MEKLIQSNRVFLREVQPEDWRAIHEYASDPEVVSYQAWGPHSEADSKAWVELSLQKQSERPRTMYYLPICLQGSGQLIGGIGFDYLSEDIAIESAEIGYSPRKDLWKQGLGYGAVRSALSFFFSNRQDLRRVVAHCRPENTSSVRLLEKLGFRREGHFILDVTDRGRLMDSFWYAITREEFQVHSSGLVGD